MSVHHLVGKQRKDVLPTAPVRKRKRKHKTKPLVVPRIDKTTVYDTVTLEEFKRLRGNDGNSDER